MLNLIPEHYPSLLKDIVAMAQEASELEERLQWLQAHCSHEIIAKPPAEFEKETWAHCAICGEERGEWYCAKSPTSLCEYPADEVADPFRESKCVHCGQPEFDRVSQSQDIDEFEQ